MPNKKDKCAMRKLVISVVAAITIIGSYAGATYASEEERNQRIQSRCQSESRDFTDDDGQTESLCQSAIYYKCLAENLCDLYPNQCSKLEAGADSSCRSLRGLGYRDCPGC
jgi:hypothetical protein